MPLYNRVEGTDSSGGQILTLYSLEVGPVVQTLGAGKIDSRLTKALVGKTSFILNSSRKEGRYMQRYRQRLSIYICSRLLNRRVFWDYSWNEYNSRE